MDKGRFPVLEVTAAVSLATIAITVAFLYFPEAPVGDIATWFAAVGTFLAFAGTIWVATTEARNRQREELIRARLHAAGMVMRLAHTRMQLRSASTCLVALVNQDNPFSSVYEVRRQTDGIDIWDINELVPLVPLPNNASAHLAQASDLINFVKKDVASHCDFSNGRFLEYQSPTYTQHIKRLDQAIELIGKGIEECRVASKHLLSNH